MPRRRKGLRGPSADAALAAVQHGVREVRRALDKGNCGKAFGELLGTAASWGNYQSADHSGARGVSISQTEGAYFEERARFRRACVIPKK